MNYLFYCLYYYSFTVYNIFIVIVSATRDRSLTKKLCDIFIAEIMTSQKRIKKGGIGTLYLIDANALENGLHKNSRATIVSWNDRLTKVWKAAI